MSPPLFVPQEMGQKYLGGTRIKLSIESVSRLSRMSHQIHICLAREFLSARIMGCTIQKSSRGHMGNSREIRDRVSLDNSISVPLDNSVPNLAGQPA